MTLNSCLHWFLFEPVRRCDHRVANISSEDLSALKSTLEASSSEIDWKTLIQTIVSRSAKRFELMYYLLNAPTTSPDDTLDLANKTQTQLRIMLLPYLLLSATPTSNKTDVDWTIPVYKLCATTHTHVMESELNSMTYSEKLLLRAIRGTSREICRVVTKMWAVGVYAGIDQSLNTKETPDMIDIAGVRRQWAEDLTD